MIRRFFFVVLSLCTAAACQETGAVTGEDSGRPPGDAGPRPDPVHPVSLEYTPDGCGYLVRTPEVAEASRDGAAIGAAPAPDHIHVSWAGPSDTTFAVNWRTDHDTHLTRVLYGTDE